MNNIRYCTLADRDGKEEWSIESILFSALLNVVADAEGPKKGGKPPRPGLHPDIPTSNAGEDSRMC